MSYCQSCREPTDAGPCPICGAIVCQTCAEAEGEFCCIPCELCDERPATHARTGTSVTPTDRGDLVEYEDRQICDECAAHMDQRP